MLTALHPSATPTGMLRITDLTFRIDGKPLFEAASATIPAGHKVGIVGRNGTGKTTLFRLITGELSPDDGEIEMPRGLRIGGVAQEAPATDDSLIDTVLAADTERSALMDELDRADPMRSAEIHARLGEIDAWSAEARAASILNGLGFDTAAQTRPCKDFSGGWRMRVALAAVLFAAPDVLLLDEPTNYLDLEGTLWLERYLARYPHMVLIISHDRSLLNRSVGAILHLHNRKLTLYQGAYDTFDATRRERLAQATAQAKKQQAARDHMQAYVDRFRYKASKARQAQSRLKMIARMEPIADDRDTAVSGFAFPNSEQLSPPIVKLDSVDIGYGETRVLHNVNLRIDADDRIALLGANGEGKSTLSKLLSGKLNPIEGEHLTARKLRVGYFAQHQVDELELNETPLQHVQRALPDLLPAKARARLASGGIGPDIAELTVTNLSGGQKARLSMLLATLHAPHLMILDEPTNHLDIESRDALVRALMDFEGAVILVSHDPHLVNAVADRLWLVKDGRVAPFDGDLDEYATLLLSERGAGGASAAQAKADRQGKRQARTLAKANLTALRSEVGKAEARVEKIEKMRAAIDERLADPELYEPRAADRLRQLQQKRAEITQGLARAEAIWETATEKLDEAEQA